MGFQVYNSQGQELQNLTGTAGGALTGTYPNPTLATTAVVIKDYKKSTFTGSAPTLSSTNWADLGGPSDITLYATAGDVIMVDFCTTWNGSNPGGFLDVVTVVGTTVTNSFAAAGAPSNSHEGIGSWRSAAVSPGGSFYYTLQSGDISSGTVKLRIRGRCSAAGSISFYTGSNFPMYFFATNLGPAPA